MLSLLNLIIASGTVLRSDNEPWTPISYPDPRNNSLNQCNTPIDSTLCDPDHILTDQWRDTIHKNIQDQVKRLKEADLLYTENAPEECHSNATDGIEIFVILAKRIQTSNNQTINGTDMTNFGDGLADKFGLSNRTCRNFLLLVGVEQAKLAYVRTGSHLKLPHDLMERAFNQTNNFFKEKNYMEGLNKFIDEIGFQMIDPFKDVTTEGPEVTETTEAEASSVNATTTEAANATESGAAETTSELTRLGDKIEIRIPIWVFLLIASLVGLLFLGAAIAALSTHRSRLSRFTAHFQSMVNPDCRDYEHDRSHTIAEYKDKCSDRLAANPESGEQPPPSLVSISTYDQVRSLSRPRTQSTVRTQKLKRRTRESDCLGRSEGERESRERKREEHGAEEAREEEEEEEEEEARARDEGRARARSISPSSIASSISDSSGPDDRRRRRDHSDDSIRRRRDKPVCLSSSELSTDRVMTSSPLPIGSLEVSQFDSSPHSQASPQSVV